MSGPKVGAQVRTTLGWIGSGQRFQNLAARTVAPQGPEPSPDLPCVGVIKSSTSAGTELHFRTFNSASKNTSGVCSQVIDFKGYFGVVSGDAQESTGGTSPWSPPSASTVAAARLGFRCPAALASCWRPTATDRLPKLTTRRRNAENASRATDSRGHRSS